MELRHLRYLVAVADEGTFVGAAERLRVAQPALSRQVRDLEREIGVELFERDSRGVSLTAAGAACVAEARGVLAHTDAAVERARLAHRGHVGRCVLAAGSVPLLTGLVARLVEALGRDFPGIELVVEERAPIELWHDLQESRVDVVLGAALMTEPADAITETQLVMPWNDAILSDAHVLAPRTEIALEELRDEPFVDWAEIDELETAQRVRAEFARRGFTPRLARAAYGVESLGTMVGAGQGWTLGPPALRGRLPWGIVSIPVRDLHVQHRIVRMRRRDDDRPVVHTVFDALRRLAEADRLAPVERPDRSIEADDASETNGRRARPELRQLRYFVAVAKHGSFGRAAEALGLSQPALSRQVRDLERELGLDLFERETRGVSLTLAGDSLLADAAQLLADVERLTVAARRARRALVGRCVVATVPTPMVRRLLTHALRDVALELPDAEVAVREIASPLQARAISDGLADIGLCNGPSSSGTMLEPVVRERLREDAMDCAIVATSHPLARRSAIALTELRDVPFLFMRREFSPPFHDAIMARFAEAGFRPRVDAEYEGLQTVWMLAAEGHGWCFGFSSQRAHPPPGVAVLPIEDFVFPWRIDLLSLPGESRPLVLTTLAALRAAARATGASSGPQAAIPSPARMQ